MKRPPAHPVAILGPACARLESAVQPPRPVAELAAAVVRAAVVTVLVAVTAVLAPPAHVTTVSPPIVDPGALPRPRTEPPEATAPNPSVTCIESTRSTSHDPAVPPPGMRLLRVPDAWRLAPRRGRGVTVAVLSTGVNPHPRLPGLRAGGDLVGGRGAGPADCDGVGTLAAGIVAGSPSPTDAFVGVAPLATILSFRTHSAAHRASGTRRRDDEPPPVGGARSGYGGVDTVAAAVVAAVDRGARVVLIPEPACAAAGTALRDAALGAAVADAYRRGSLVITGAGDVAPDRCAAQNGAAGGAHPAAGGWDTVRTVASPAWFAPYVLVVGAADAVTGAAQPWSLAGPWIGVTAPGTHVAGPDPTTGRRGLIDAQSGPIHGTAFAAAYIAGLAALLYAERPDSTPRQVTDAITGSAHSPGGHSTTTGWGVADAVAALTQTTAPTTDRAAAERPITEPPTRPRRDTSAVTPALGIALGCLLVLAAAGLAGLRPRRRDDPAASYHP